MLSILASVLLVSSAPPPPDLISVLTSKITPTERTRFLKERGAVGARDDGRPMATYAARGFLFVIERSLLPDDRTAAKMAGLGYLQPLWNPGEPVGFSGERAAPWREMILGALDPGRGGSREDARRAGGVQIHHSREVTIQNGDRTLSFVLDSQPKLSEASYPAGDAPEGSDPKREPSASADRESAAAPLGAESSERSIEALDPLLPDETTEAASVAMEYLARRWREDRQKLRERFAELDGRLESDLDSRLRHKPKENAPMSEQTPEFREAVAEHFARGYRAFGFESADAARAWARGSSVGTAHSLDLAGFGIIDPAHGKGGGFVEIDLFKP